MFQFQFDAFAQQPPQHEREFAHNIAQNENARLQGLLAREGEQLSHQGCGAQCVLMDLVDFLERWIGRLMAHEQEFAVADDDGQEIVEVVRHAARELPHGLHLLRLREFGFERLLLGDVDQIKDRAIRIAAIGRARIEFRHAVGLARGTQFDRRGFAAARGCARDHFADAGAIGRFQRVTQRATRERTAKSEEVRKGRVGFEQAPFGVRKRDTDGRVLGKRHRRCGDSRGRRRGRRFCRL